MTAYEKSLTQSVSLQEYVADQVRSGASILPGEQNTYWTRYESHAFMRLPTFYVGPADSKEVSRTLRRGRAVVASYLLEPDNQHPANAWLYVCTDQSYALEKLPSAMRRNVRRGLKELTIAPLTGDDLLAHGSTAFCDTRRRAGLTDGTPERFTQYFSEHVSQVGHTYLGAWKDGQLAAYLTIVEVDDWAELGCYSQDNFLQYRPNDTLMYSVLSHYLVERRFRLVSYGLSSIQAESNAEGLHRFKLKIGFEARPVHRAFVLNPLLRPFANRLSLQTVNVILKVRPGDRRLKKAGGMLANMLGEVHMPDTGEASAVED